MTSGLFERRLAPLLLLFVAGCAYRPARFADRPPVVAVADDAPSRVPKPRIQGGALDVSDLYLRHAIMDALDPRRTPTAGDVNAMDEVVQSTWFRPRDGSFAASLEEDGPPVLPLRILPGDPVTQLSGVRAEDARGLSYELQIDPPDRPELRTAAAVIASRLLGAVGYLTPEVWPVDVAPSDLTAPGEVSSEVSRVRAFLASGPPPKDGKVRLSATRWPIGIDLGATPASGVRSDDQNDRIAHHDRRTFRAFQLVCAWLSLDRYDDGLFRDVYVGEPSEGHVEHFVSGTGGALGAEAIVRATDLIAADPVPEDPALPLLTFGFYPQVKVQPTQTRWPAIGAITSVVAPSDYRFTQPFEPHRRALPGDLYWMAKRIAALSPDRLAHAIAAGRLSDGDAATHLFAILLARQRAVVTKALAEVTPCEPSRVEGVTLWVRDEAIGLGVESQEGSRYRITFLNQAGERLAPEELRPAEAEGFSVRIPDAALAADYVVARILSVRRGAQAPRAVEVHLRQSGDGVRVVGVRH